MSRFFPNSLGFVMGYTIHPETNEIRGKKVLSFFRSSCNRLARLLLVYHMEKKKQGIIACEYIKYLKTIQKQNNIAIHYPNGHGIYTGWLSVAVFSAFLPTLVATYSDSAENTG